MEDEENGQKKVLVPASSVPEEGASTIGTRVEGLNDEITLTRPGCKRKIGSSKTCELLPMIWFVAVLLVCCSTMSVGKAMCPSRCSCRDEALEASCTDAGLEFIPIQLNPDLQFIDLKENRISNILYALSVYSQLRHVDISVNRLQTIGSRNFVYQTHLLTLNVSHNQITSLGKDALKGMKSLKSIDLSNNEIEKIDSLAFSDMVSLETLNLAHNRLTSLEGEAIFASMQVLRVLILENNEIIDVPSQALKSLPPHAQLSALLLSYNLIQTLNETAFPYPQVSNLSRLTLGYNVLSEIHKSAFNSLHDVTWMDLSFNNLTQIPTQQLSKLTKLSVLDLSGNEFSDVGAVSFKSLFQLKFLRLSRMPHLGSIDARAFVDNIQLETVIITENMGLKRIPSRIFHGNPNLNYVQMQGNSLTSLDASHFPLGRLKELNISENPLHCNCSLLWLWVLVRLQMKTMEPSSTAENGSLAEVNHGLKIHLENLKCMSPEEFKMKLVGEIPEDAVRCETSWITVAVSSAIILAFLSVLLIGLFLVLSGKRVRCRKSKGHGNTNSLESRGIIVNGLHRHPPVLTLYPEEKEKAYTSMLVNGYLMQPSSPSFNQYRGSMEHWNPFASIGSTKKMANEYSDQVPPMKKAPHIVYV